MATEKVYSKWCVIDNPFLFLKLNGAVNYRKKVAIWQFIVTAINTLKEPSKNLFVIYPQNVILAL